MKTTQRTRQLVGMAALAAIIIILQVAVLIPLGPFYITLTLVPLILGAILYGPAAGAVLGAVFGLCSIWANTTTPGLLSFAFSPFMSTEGLVGAVKSIWIALGCRILFGFIAGWMWKAFKKLLKQDYLALPVTAALATICHTLLVMGSIYVLLAQQYAEAKNVAITAVFGLVMGTVTASGIPEAIAAAILVTAIGKALLHLMARLKKR